MAEAYLCSTGGVRGRVVRTLRRVAAFSSALQRIGETVDKVRYPPPGRMVDIGGRKLHMREFGSAGPTVVIETGAGALASGWDPVAERLAGDCRIITYDRAGYGWSDAAPFGRRTGEDVAGDLHALLESAGVAPPYVLVGHSLGGLYIRSFWQAYPGEVAGLVFVDSSHERQMERFREERGNRLVVLQAVASGAMFAVPRGLARVAVELGLLDRAASRTGISKAEGRVALSRYLRSAFRWASVAEMIGMAETSRLLREGDRRIGVPIAVVTAAPPEPGSRSPIAPLYPVWRELQADLASLSDRSTHTTGTKGGHFVQDDDPDTVLAAIRGIALSAK